MISQADIIKTLVNKNCTDESIMAVALSPDCTTYKLMTKLTEAERFDLALDVSMKLGIDVAPLWRTWAMRCLKNRNFHVARDKFRQCFLRINVIGRKQKSRVQNTLLNEILSELCRMDERQFSLQEQIGFIKQRQPIPLVKEHLKARTKIYNECLFYLNVYGTIEDTLLFYVKNNLWDETSDLLGDKGTKSLTKFFVEQVFPSILSRGHLKDLMDAFTRVRLSSNSPLNICLVELYNFCTLNRRPNTLCYIQTCIGDLMGAVETQINLVFNQKPVSHYRELAQRISSLQQAASYAREYIAQSEGKAQTNVVCLGQDYSITEAKQMLTSIEIQMELTRNFAINEVSGCPCGLECDIDDKECKSGALSETPVTLFDKNEVRKTFLAALVLIYFDLSSSAYFSKSGLELANKIIEMYELDKLRAFKMAMRIIIEDESCDILENASLLIERLKEDYAINKFKAKTGYESFQGGHEADVGVSRETMSSAANQQTGKSMAQRHSVADGHSLVVRASRQAVAKKLVPDVQAICDEVIRDSIGNCREADYKMELAKLLSSEAKIKLYIEHGKLSNAQRLACNMSRPDYVSHIIEEAERLNQDHVKTVCQLWLAKHETRNFKR